MLDESQRPNDDLPEVFSALAGSSDLDMAAAASKKKKKKIRRPDASSSTAPASVGHVVTRRASAVAATSSRKPRVAAGAARLLVTKQFSYKRNWGGNTGATDARPDHKRKDPPTANQGAATKRRR
ncbi:hypothetical protein V5O48_012008 [Marasmius crinis-equi]|uniref:Uncharacterized protein n=1 Tax=Marasmius crinis-equi TaxID=585013 RepID=A0ABR3F3Y7_9AGAR